MQNHQNGQQKFLKKFLTPFAFILFFNLAQARHPEDPMYVEYADNITKKFCADVAKKHLIFYYGGGGGFLKNVERIFLDFSAVKNLNIEEARSLVLDCTEDLLQRINNDKKIKPYLEHYPFTEKGLRLSISFDTPDQKRVSSKYVAHVLATNGSIYYSSYDHKKQQLVDLYEEPYQEALKLANAPEIK
ncbi:MAG: hypothetical protein FJZ63_06385 [Chlamydiae bacterium]|nr:hypothetical protein [Chlamydiota bacterium]